MRLIGIELPPRVAATVRRQTAVEPAGQLNSLFIATLSAADFAILSDGANRLARVR